MSCAAAFRRHARDRGDQFLRSNTANRCNNQPPTNCLFELNLQPNSENDPRNINPGVPTVTLLHYILYNNCVVHVALPLSSHLALHVHRRLQPPLSPTQHDVRLTRRWKVRDRGEPPVAALREEPGRSLGTHSVKCWLAWPERLSECTTHLAPLARGALAPGGLSVVQSLHIHISQQSRCSGHAVQGMGMQ